MFLPSFLCVNVFINTSIIGLDREFENLNWGSFPVELINLEFGFLFPVSNPLLLLSADNISTSNALYPYKENMLRTAPI
jgi:hypothetical protein